MGKQSVMTSRERVLAAVRGQPVDRVPVMYWLNPHTTCRLLAQAQPGRSRAASMMGRLFWRRFLRQGEFDGSVWARALPLLLEEYGNGPYVLDLGADICILSPGMISPGSFVRSVRKRDGRLQVRGPFGGTLALGGIYMDPLEPAVSHIGELERFQLPPVREDQFAGVRRFRRDHPDACLLVEVAAFQQALCDYILGTEAFMLALYDHPAEIRTFMARMADWIVRIIEHAVKAGADIAYLQDDYGMTGQALISPKMWTELTLPHLKRFVATAHALGVPFMLHSCGYQMCFLEAYVEAGIDALQSFQPKAGNDFAAAYAQYGDRLTFATGIDVQRGEGMSPAALRQEILENVRLGRERGRYILSMTHMMQYTMPIENVRAILETVREIQAGVHD